MTHWVTSYDAPRLRENLDRMEAEHRRTERASAEMRVFDEPITGRRVPLNNPTMYPRAELREPTRYEVRPQRGEHEDPLPSGISVVVSNNRGDEIARYPWSENTEYRWTNDGWEGRVVHVQVRSNETDELIRDHGYMAIGPRNNLIFRSGPTAW